MSRKKTIIIEIIFNSWGGDPLRLTREWIEYRLDLFFASVVKSLLQQTSQDFTCFVVCDPASDEVITDLLQDHPRLPPTIRFVNKVEYRRQEREIVETAEVFYRVFLSSDDMYRRDFIEQLHTYQPGDQAVALVPQYGYLYDSVQSRLGQFFFWLPSYGAVILDSKKYLSRQYPNVYGYSWREALKLPHEFIFVKEPVWINHIHGRNTGTTFQDALRWRDPAGKSAFSLEPWSNSERSRACFGPEISDPAAMQAILDEYF